ncbi:MAG: DUF86 domain-containing protein [Verrucomicrobia bacterium]|nr:DUF86 domain-containing protein [Verrucomicrobiota bacterium]
MNPPKPPSAYLFEMLESARIVRDYVAGLTFDDFWDRGQTRDAVAMRLTVIGEAAGKVDAATVAALPAVPFPKISATRNRIVHDYGKVNFNIVWQITQEEIPSLIAALETHFKENPPPRLPP